jgi:hypothetical protein
MSYQGNTRVLQPISQNSQRFEIENYPPHPRSTNNSTEQSAIWNRGLPPSRVPQTISQNSQQFEDKSSLESPPPGHLSSLPPELMLEFLEYMKTRIKSYLKFNPDGGKDDLIVDKIQEAIDALTLTQKNLVAVEETKIQTGIYALKNKYLDRDQDINKMTKFQKAIYFLTKEILVDGQDINIQEAIIDLTKENLVAVQEITRERIGVLSFNTITKASERLKIYTCLYIVVFIYLYLHGYTDKSRFTEIVDEILISEGTLGRTLISGLGTIPVLGSFVSNKIKKNLFLKGGRSKKRKTRVKSQSRKHHL